MDRFLNRARTYIESVETIPVFVGVVGAFPKGAIASFGSGLFTVGKNPEPNEAKIG